MKRRLLVIMLLLAGTPALQAQPKGFSPLKNTGAFQESLAAANAQKNTISSDFNQVKNLSLLSEKIKSNGKFYFKKEDKVRIEYLSPYAYLVVMNAGQVMVKDEQKSNRVNTRNNKAMQSVNKIMLDCMRGTVFTNSDFKVNAFENASQTLLNLVPATDAMKKMFKQIDVYMDKKRMDVQRLSLVETNGDFTDMNFVNTKHNLPIDEALFKTK